MQNIRWSPEHGLRLLAQVGTSNVRVLAQDDPWARYGELLKAIIV